MDFLGIGPLEILFILVIALILFGPRDIIKAGQAAGRFLRKLVTSPGWMAIQQTSRDLRNLPNKLIREAGLEEIKQDMEEIKQDVGDIKTIAQPLDLNKELQGEIKEIKEGLSAWTTPIDLETPKEGAATPENPNAEAENK